MAKHILVTLPKARTAFEFHNRTMNLSPRTTTWYDKNLHVFEEWITKTRKREPSSVALDSIKPDELREFLTFLRGRSNRYETHNKRTVQQGGLSPYTIRGYQRSLSAFFRWAVKEHYLTANPMEKVESMKMPKQLKDIFTDEELKRLVKACDTYPEAIRWRNRALLLLLLDTGMRSAELCGLLLQNIADDFQRAKVLGKGMRERWVPLGHATREAVFKYINFYRPNPIRPAKNAFLSGHGRVLNNGTLSLILRELGERAGVAKCNPHKFRHTALTLFYKNSNGNLFLTQMLAGHESPTTTRIYAHMNTVDLEDVHRRASPVGGLDL